MQILNFSVACSANIRTGLVICTSNVSIKPFMACFKSILQVRGGNLRPYNNGDHTFTTVPQPFAIVFVIKIGWIVSNFNSHCLPSTWSTHWLPSQKTDKLLLCLYFDWWPIYKDRKICAYLESYYRQVSSNYDYRAFIRLATEQVRY